MIFCAHLVCGPRGHREHMYLTLAVKVRGMTLYLSSRVGGVISNIEVLYDQILCLRSLCSGLLLDHLASYPLLFHHHGRVPLALDCECC